MSESSALGTEHGGGGGPHRCRSGNSGRALVGRSHAVSSSLREARQQQLLATGDESKNLIRKGRQKRASGLGAVVGQHPKKKTEEAADNRRLLRTHLNNRIKTARKDPQARRHVLRAVLTGLWITLILEEERRN